MRKVYIAILFTLLSLQTVLSQSSLIESLQTTESHLDMEQELRFPQVGPKLKNYIVSYMQQVARNLYRDGFEVETMRNGEVVIVSIPTDGLFIPNETTLLPSAEKSLQRLAQFIETPGRFKIVLACHSDNTGSLDYSFDLTEGRINTILDYFEERNLPLDNVVGFPRGQEDPLVDNDNRPNRARNRRLEVFILPAEGLLAEARNKGK